MIVISPAKRLTNNSSDSSLPTTVPAFKKEADLLAKQLSKMNIADLGSMMKVSESIAELNNLRYKNWDKNIYTSRRV